MATQKKITGVREDKKGVNCAYQFDGRSRWVAKKDAIKLAEKDKIANAVLVNEGKRNAHLRSPPNLKKKDNHDEMAKKNPKKKP